MLTAHRSIGLAVALFAVVGVSAAGRTEPVDLSDPTPREVLVQVDENVDDYAAIGAAFGAPLSAQLASDGVMATITVGASAIEALIQSVFGGAATVVPGSFSDYVIEIDVATGDVLSASAGGQVTVPIVGTIDVVQTASSNGIAGFQLSNIFGYLVPIFCTSGTSCTVVPGLPYDPATGQLNAVGEIATIFDVFTPFGDMKLSEVPPPLACDVTMNQASFVDGELMVLTSLRFTNTSPSAVPTRMRLQLSLPFGITYNAIDLGAGGGFSMPASFDRQLGPATMTTVTPSFPRGDFEWRCAFEDPVTGAIQGEDRAPFTVQ